MPFFQANLIIIMHSLMASKKTKHKKQRLQLIRNSAARLNISPVLTALHRLPVTFRNDFKVLLLSYKALHGLHYIDKSHYLPSSTLQLSAANLLEGPSNSFLC